ncbi:MAG: hypothetical protein KJ702_08030, partial [Gammaproteobacteria bacterium]|nr:hypothetical protein [Gammaproteobacteria bacterium]
AENTGVVRPDFRKTANWTCTRYIPGKTSALPSGCAACEGNTPIKLGCGVDGHKERIRKEGRKFYRECTECKSSSLFFENPV